MTLEELLRLIPVRQSHWLQHRLGLFAGMHSWMPEFCPCWGRR